MSITGTPNWALTVKDYRARPLSGNSQQSSAPVFEARGAVLEALRIVAYAATPSRTTRDTVMTAPFNPQAADQARDAYRNVTFMLRMEIRCVSMGCLYR
jgi:hypothetical protein